jgi:type VI secretion system protein ImpG
MDSKLLTYYERELHHLREMGAEFAREFPKIASRLGLENYSCTDPYVERLLEGFSFLAARVQLKIDAEFPQFTEQLLELVYPQYLSPTPSMTIVRFQPDLTETSLVNGFNIPRLTALHNVLDKGDYTPCEFRTAHDVTLWPIELVAANYFSYSGAVNGINLSHLGPIKAGLRLRLRTNSGLSFNALPLDCLHFHLLGSGALPSKMLEQLLAHTTVMVAMPATTVATWYQPIAKSNIKHLGFEDEHALLPYGARSFEGYRLLHEYFAFAQRYLFVELGGLAPAIKRCQDEEIDLVILFNQVDPSLEPIVESKHFSLYCSPAINLFPKRCDRIYLSDEKFEHHVVPDRMQPIDYEIYQINRVVGYGTGTENEQVFEPFYAANDLSSASGDRAYYQIRRSSRVLSEREHQQGIRSRYLGSETFISLVDAQEAPYRNDLSQIAIQALCTNRDLPLGIQLGTGKTDFTTASEAPLKSIRCLTSPTLPAPSYAQSTSAWRLISHLSLNYLSLTDQEPNSGAASLKELLQLYCLPHDVVSHRQIEAIQSIVAEPIVRRLPGVGPITYGRGLKITLSIDETPFEGMGVFVLGAVLAQFFAKYVSINSFIETWLKTPSRGLIMQWPAQVGRCEIL